MFKFLKKQAEVAVQEQQQPKVEVKTRVQIIQDKLIEEIHASFFTEVDKLLEYAKVSLSTDTQHQALLDKATKLEKLGFKSACAVNQATTERKRLEDIRNENRNRELLVEAIKYFQYHYPNYKFITFDSIMKICNKYGLLLGMANIYKGDVPAKCIEQMMNFKVKKEDVYYLDSNDNYHESQGRMKRYESYSYYNYDKRRVEMDGYDHNRERLYESGLLIAAPPKEFNLEKAGLTVEGKCIVDKDPVVFKRVLHNSRLYYLIVTAWGKEASDELVVNEKMN